MVAATDLLIVGAGAKAAGIATKVHVLNRLGLGPISLKIVEGTERAASWLGRNGMTSGEEPLAVTPIKDIGFPYQSFYEFGEAGEAIDAAAHGVLLAAVHDQQAPLRALDRRRLALGAPPRLRRVPDLGAGAGDRGSRARARVGSTEVSLDEEGDRWVVEVEEPSGGSRHAGGALVLTGPGVHRAFPHEPGIAARVFHCDSRRSEFARLPEDECDVAVVGGGESALSCVMFLRGFRPRARCTIYTPMLPMSRGESFLENRVFSNPDEVEWSALDLQTRRDFVKHSDRGVFDPPSLAAIAYDDRFRFVTGRVTDVGAAPGGDGVRVEYESPEGVAGGEHDYVVNCTGFDLLAQLRDLFPPEVRERGREPGGAALGPPGRDRGADRPRPRAGGDGAATPHSRARRAEPGAGVREPRRARPALQPGAPAACSKKSLLRRDLATAELCNINLYRLSNC